MANNITVAGNVGKDAEVRYLATGTATASFSVADSQINKDKTTIWWNCTIFGDRAEKLAQYIVKGDKITVFGNVTEREWDDNQGVKQRRMEIRVNDVALQGGKRGDD